MSSTTPSSVVWGIFFFVWPTVSSLSAFVSGQNPGCQPTARQKDEFSEETVWAIADRNSHLHECEEFDHLNQSKENIEQYEQKADMYKAKYKHAKRILSGERLETVLRCIEMKLNRWWWKGWKRDTAQSSIDRPMMALLHYIVLSPPGCRASIVMPCCCCWCLVQNIDHWVGGATH